MGNCEGPMRPWALGTVLNVPNARGVASVVETPHLPTGVMAAHECTDDL